MGESPAKNELMMEHHTLYWDITDHEQESTDTTVGQGNQTTKNFRKEEAYHFKITSDGGNWRHVDETHLARC